MCADVIQVGSPLLPARSFRVTGSWPIPRAREQACIGRGVSHTLGLNSSWQVMHQGIHAQSPRRHGRRTNQPDNAPYGGFDPDLPCYPPPSARSSRSEVDTTDRRQSPAEPNMPRRSHSRTKSHKSDSCTQLTAPSWLSLELRTARLTPSYMFQSSFECCDFSPLLHLSLIFFFIVDFQTFTMASH